MKVINSGTINNVLDKIGTKLNSPEQRLLQGVVALGIQPFIDFRNKGTDDDTRAVSTARTIGKIIAGTTVGVCVRAGSIAITKNFSKFKINGQEITLAKKLTEQIAAKTKIIKFEKIDKRSIFTPNIADKVIDMSIEDFERKYNNFTKTWGTVLGICAMVFTNFLIDVPITKAITKHLTQEIKAKIDKDNEKQPRKQVNNAAF